MQLPHRVHVRTSRICVRVLVCEVGRLDGASTHAGSSRLTSKMEGWTDSRDWPESPRLSVNANTFSACAFNAHDLW